MSARSSGVGSAVQLIKCFCGCSDMTIEEVKRIYSLTNSVRETLLDVEATKLLHKFLELHRSGDKGDTEQYLDVYEKCSEFLLEEYQTFTLNEVEELCELGLPYNLERDLTIRMRRGQSTDIKLGLNRIQGECCNEISASADFERFRAAILEKLNRVPK